LGSGEVGGVGFEWAGEERKRIERAEEEKAK
jgi:hypothetical protein